MRGFFWRALGIVAVLLVAVVIAPAVAHAWPHNALMDVGGLVLATGVVAPFPGNLSMTDILRRASPPGWNPNDQENIWYDWYDTRRIVSGEVINIDFFQELPAGNDKSFSNMKAAGQFPSPYSLRIYPVCCDIFPVIEADPSGPIGEQVSNSADETGFANDAAKIILGHMSRWQLVIDDKEYGPQRLSLLHGTGGAGWGGWGGFEADFQYGVNDRNPGWNYGGEVIIPTQTPFRFTVLSSTTIGPLDLTTDWYMTIHLQGVAARGAR